MDEIKANVIRFFLKSERDAKNKLIFWGGV